MLWAFLECVTTGRRGVITEWYEEMPMEAQQDFDDLLRYLRSRPVTFGCDLSTLRFLATRDWASCDSRPTRFSIGPSVFLARLRVNLPC